MSKLTHRYEIGEKVFLGMDDEVSDIILEKVPAEKGSDVLGYILKDNDFIFESSISYSEKELRG